MQQMLNICTEFGVDYDVKFNDMKSVAMRVGPRFHVACKPLDLSGKVLRFVDSREDLDELKQRLRTEWIKLDHVVIVAAFRQWRCR